MIWPTRIKQDNGNNLNRYRTSSESKAIIKVLLAKTPGPDGFTGEFSQTFKEELALMLLQEPHKVSHKAGHATKLFLWIWYYPDTKTT